MTVRSFLSRAFLAVGRRLAPEPAVASAPPKPADRSAGQGTDAGLVGLNDVCKSGWFNNRSGELLAGFQITAEDTVVDVGSGDGGFARFCARYKPKIILIDVDQERLNYALNMVKGEGVVNAEGFVSDASRLPLPDESVTRVICTEVLEHVDDPAQSIAELVRIGKPGARYLISVPGSVSEHLQKPLAPPSHFAKPNHLRIFEEHEIRSLLEDAGLIVESRRAYGFFWTAWWLFFWESGVELGAPGSSVLLDRWTLTWKTLLESERGLQIKRVLDDLAPKSIAFVARKPG